MADLPHAVDYGHGEIFTATLRQLDVLSLHLFSLFYSLYNFLIYGVSLNRALHVFDDDDDIALLDV
jgi:hypothetical protein